MRGNIEETTPCWRYPRTLLSQGMRQAAEMAVENESTTENGLKSAPELAEHLNDTASLEDQADAALEAFKGARQKLQEKAEKTL